MLFSKRLSLSVLAVAALLANAAPVPRHARRSLGLASGSAGAAKADAAVVGAVVGAVLGAIENIAQSDTTPKAGQVSAAPKGNVALAGLASRRSKPLDDQVANMSDLTAALLAALQRAQAEASEAANEGQMGAAKRNLQAMPDSTPTRRALAGGAIPVATLPPPALPIVTVLPPAPAPPVVSPSPAVASRLIFAMPVVPPKPNPSGSIGSAVPPVAASITTTTQTVTTTISGAQPTKTCDPNSKKHKAIKKEDHEDPTKTITLYHAVADDDNRIQMLLAGPQANQRGDFNANGAFYTTDNSQAAAQYACYVGKHKKAVAMFEYEWNPAGAKIHQFSCANGQWRSFINSKGTNTNIISNDMVTGPLRPQKDIARNFWQFAVSQSGLPRLKLRSVHHGLMCSDIPKGDLCT